MQLAAVQLSVGLDKAVNRTRAVAAVRSAAAGGAGVVVLPEAAMADFGGRDQPLGPLAEPLDGPFVASLVDVAGQTGVVVVAGMFETGPEPTKAYNTVVAVSGAGLLGYYRKVHLFDALGWRESDRLTPGPATADALVVLDLDGIRLGILTCFDLRFPEVARLLAARGATAIAVPAAWVAGEGKADQWRVLLQARAIENTLYVAGADQAGPRYAGHSLIVDPAGAVLGELDGATEAPLVATLDPERVAEVRRTLPLLDLRRFPVGEEPPLSVAERAD